MSSNGRAFNRQMVRNAALAAKIAGAGNQMTVVEIEKFANSPLVQEKE